MVKGAIYYTDYHIDPVLMGICQRMLRKNFDGEIVSVALDNPLSGNDFEDNIAIDDDRGYPALIRQIRTALEASTADYVFFTEHDVLYPPSHFDFVPPRDNIFYYNENVWRWELGAYKAIRYERMLPLSCLCVNRLYALEHYKLRERAISGAGEDAFKSNEPVLARRWGYEPGTKKKKRGGLTDDDFETWRSREPVIDIRHDKTFSPPKITRESFRHAPVNWQEISISVLPYWDLRNISDL